MESENHGIRGSWNHKNHKMMELEDSRITKSWNNRVRESENHGVRGSENHGITEAQSNGTIKSANPGKPEDHGMVWGLERTFRTTPFQAPATARDNSNYPRSLRAPSNLSWDTSRNGAEPIPRALRALLSSPASPRGTGTIPGAYLGPEPCQPPGCLESSRAGLGSALIPAWNQHQRSTSEA